MSDQTPDLCVVVPGTRGRLRRGASMQPFCDARLPVGCVVEMGTMQPLAAGNVSVRVLSGASAVQIGELWDVPADSVAWESGPRPATREG